MLSFLYAELTVVVCVDCVSAGATAYQAFWRRFLGRYGEYGDVDIGGGSIPKRGSPRFITRVVGAYEPEALALMEKYQVRSAIQTFFTHRSVSTFDRDSFRLTGELFFCMEWPSGRHGADGAREGGEDGGRGVEEVPRGDVSDEARAATASRRAY